jgi:hypothetical protein
MIKYIRVPMHNEWLSKLLEKLDTSLDDVLVDWADPNSVVKPSSREVALAIINQTDPPRIALGSDWLFLRTRKTAEFRELVVRMLEEFQKEVDLG